ncbi:nuclear protein SNF4 [Trichoderma ceciliae]
MEENAEAVSAQLPAQLVTVPVPAAETPGGSGSDNEALASPAPGSSITNSITSSTRNNDNDNDNNNNDNNNNDNGSSSSRGSLRPTAGIGPEPAALESASSSASAASEAASGPGPDPRSGSGLWPEPGLGSSPGSAARPDTGYASNNSVDSASSATTPTPGLKQRPSAIALPPFVAPSSYLRFNTTTCGAMLDAPDPKPLSPLDKEQQQGLEAIREFLRKRTSYDVLPLSFRLIVLDTDLLIKKSLNILIQNSIVSAPLWDSHTARFAGILTATDYINVIQYHCQFPDEMSKLDQFRLGSLRDIEKAIGATPIESVSVHPSRPLYEALRRMLKTRARRIPLVDVDDETGRETVISVITQYRILKFIAVNNEHNTILLKKTLREIQMGTYTDMAVARMGTTVLEVINLMVNRNISCVPIVDSQNRVLNAFEAVDVIPSIKGGAYDDLNGTVGEALCKRPEDNPGIFTCSQDDRLDSIFDTIRKSRVHRLIVVDDENKLKGVISLSDILKYVLLHGEEGISE